MSVGGAQRVGIAGAGAVALGTAAFLKEAGHTPILWSPSGEGTAPFKSEPLTAKGAVETAFAPVVAASAQALAETTDIIVIALPAYGHKAVFDALAPHLADGQPVIISSHASFGALYLSRQLAERGVHLPIVSWGTTLVTGRRSGTTVNVNTVRQRIDCASLPADDGGKSRALCQALFGERFVDRGSLMAIALSNLNPQNHMGIALCNMTRMEHGETWSQGHNVTPNVGRLLEALDAERLAIAEALGLKVRTIFEHFSLSFHVPQDTVSAMNQKMHAEGRGGTGPATADSRYVTEDVPYGLLVTVKLGELVGRPATLHKAGVQTFCALYGRDFMAENDLLAALDLDAMGLDQLLQLAREGYGKASAAATS